MLSFGDFSVVLSLSLFFVIKLLSLKSINSIFLNLLSLSVITLSNLSLVANSSPDITVL